MLCRTLASSNALSWAFSRIIQPVNAAHLHIRQTLTEMSARKASVLNERPVLGEEFRFGKVQFQFTYQPWWVADVTIGKGVTFCRAIGSTSK